MQLSISQTGALELAKQLEGSSVKAGFRAAVLTRHYGQLLVTRVQAKASGRPGPRAPTGDYRRSWGLILGADGLDSWAEAGTNKPQGRRLELGFSGQDSLGRSYNQPPYEHAGPALDEVGAEFALALPAAVIRP